MLKDNWRKKYTNEIDMLESTEFSFLMKLHNDIAKATFDFFCDNTIQYVPVPQTTGSASSPMEPGSDSLPVKIQIKNGTTLLTDSAQFYLEYACRTSKKGCFYYGHSFRDEEPDTRHLAQFSHAEAEIIGTLNDVKKVVEKYIKYVTKNIYKSLKFTGSDEKHMETKILSLTERNVSFESVSFQDAINLLKNQKNALMKCDTGIWRITPEGEKSLLEELGEFVWIEHWDRMAVPFYQAYDAENGFSLNADLLFGIGEVVGAGQRHVGSKELKKALRDHGLLEDNYKWYIEMKNRYPLQTAGFGMGVERYLMWLLDINDIRSVELFPRSRLQTGEI